VIAEPEALLREVGAQKRDVRQWAVEVPVTRRGPLTVAIGVGDHTVALRTFVMRGPDRAHEEIHRHLLRKTLGTRLWRFALDADGALYAVADLPRDGLTAEVLDGALGLVAALVDETYEGILRTGFDLSAGMRLAPPPGESPPA